MARWSKAIWTSTTLTEIAQATHGSYQPLGALGEGLDIVRKRVEDTSDTARLAKMRTLGVDRFSCPSRW